MATEKLEIVISAVDKATGPVSKITKSFRGFGKFALKGLAIGAGAAGTALVGLGAAAAKLAIDAAPLQQVQSAFEGVAEAAGVGSEEMLKAMQEGSSGMIANRDLMISFNKAASLVSQDFAKQLPDAMGMLSKVSAATGQDLDFLLDSLVTGVGRVSPMILDNLGIQVSVAEATQRAAEMFGLEASELSKTQQQAGLMNVVMEKLSESTKDIPEVTGSAMQGWAAFKTTLQNTKDEIGLALLPVFTPLLNSLGSLASEWLPKAVEAIKPFLERLGIAAELFSEFGFNAGTIRFALEQIFGKETVDKVLGMVDTLTKFKDNVQQTVQPAIEGVSSWLKDNLPPAITTAKSFFENQLLPAIQSISTWITGTLIPAFFGFANWVQNNIPIVQGFIQNLFTNIKEWWNANGAVVMAALLTAWEVVKATVSAAIDVIRPAVEGFFETVRDKFEDFEPLIEKFKDLWIAIQPIVAVVMATVGALVLLAVGIITGAFRGLANAIGPLIDTFIDVVGGIVTFLTGVANYVTGFVELIIALFQGNTEGVKSALLKMKEASFTIWQGIVDTVTGLVGGLVETVLAFVEGLWTGVVEFFTNLYNDLVGGSLVPDLVDRILGFIGDLYDEWIQIWDDIKQWVFDIIDDILNFDWAGTGKAIVQGIANGISGAAGLIANAAKNAAGAAFEAAKGFLGIDSPSKLFAEMGKNMMEGMAMGIQGASSAPAAEAVATTSQVTSTVQNHWNLTINEAGRAVDPVRSFEIMKALAGGRP